MNMQAVLIRAAILLVMCFGLSIAMTRRPAAQESLRQSSPAAKPGAVAAAQMPTVVLPTIMVRPSAAEIAAAMNGQTAEIDDPASFTGTARDRSIFDTAGSLRSLRPDMPYYSFGKALPRVSKE